VPTTLVWRFYQDDFYRGGNDAAGEYIFSFPHSRECPISLFVSANPQRSAPGLKRIIESRKMSIPSRGGGSEF